MILVRILTVLAILLAAGCDLPKDTYGSYDAAIDGYLHIAVTHNPPWVCSASITGIEVRLLEAFAASLNASPIWHPLSEQQLVSSLKAGRIQLAVGGFETGSAWIDQVGATRPYYLSRVMFVRQGENRLLSNLERFLDLRCHENCALAQF